jgi:hypothetical protein
LLLLRLVDLSSSRRWLARIWFCDGASYVVG